MKKTIFSKIFRNNIFSALIALIIVTSMQFALTTNYITGINEKALKRNAHIIAALVRNGTSMEYLSTFMVGFSRSVNRNIIIIDNQGNIIVHSFVTEDYNSEIKKIPQMYCRDVLENKETTVKGSLGGVYSSDMLTLQIPIVNIQNENQVLGAVMISMPFPEMQEMQKDLFKISLLCMLIVICVSFIFAFTVSKNICKPIKQISGTAEKFAKRNFGERIDLKKSSYNIKEMKELADTFNHMATELEKSDNIRNNFISDVSHELRTPMTTIKGFVDGILDGTIPEERRADYLKIVSDEVARLTKLVNNFLDVSRIENNNIVMEFKNFDITELIRISVIGLEKRIDEKHIAVELNFEEPNMFVFADLDSIKRVITNLLDNAVKFTDENGKICVSVKKTKKEISISVYNTGVGISKDDIDYVFKRFYKADKSRSINKEGTGIGLYIVGDIIAKHGKKISVESQEGKYAKFEFSLDCGKSVK